MNKENLLDSRLDQGVDDRKKLLEKQEQLRQQLRNDRIKLMQQPEFKRVVADLINRAKLHQVTFTGNAQGNFLEGRRSLGLEILTTLQEAIGSDVYDIFKLTYGEEFDG